MTFFYLIKTQHFQFKYSFGGSENPVANAVLANLRGKFTKPDKPKVSVPVCSEYAMSHSHPSHHLLGTM